MSKRLIARGARALEAYERLDSHFQNCEECADEGACEMSSELWQEARRLREKALPPRAWTHRQLGLRASDSRPIGAPK